MTFEVDVVNCDRVPYDDDKQGEQKQDESLVTHTTRYDPPGPQTTRLTVVIVDKVFAI